MSFGQEWWEWLQGPWWVQSWAGPKAPLQREDLEAGRAPEGPHQALPLCLAPA